MYFLVFSIFALSACSTNTSNKIDSSDISKIMQLIAKTEEIAPLGVEGTFQLPIRASGKQSNVLYLNTEQDYRDRRNITVAIHPSIIEALTKKYGESPGSFFLQKQIEVKGVAKRAQIDFYSQRRKTKKYYFQTHIRVSSIDQIKVLRELNTATIH